MQSLYPQSTFRLEVLPTQVLRHGDVIQAHRDERRVFEVGAFLVPEVKHSERWLVGATEILITSVDLGVVRVRVPTRHTPDSLMDALQQCFGHQRCHGAYLHRLSIQQRSLDIYCLSRGNQDTLTAVLSDVDEASGLILLTTIDGPRDEPLSVDSLRWAPESLGDFWQDVLTRDVVWLRTVKNRFAPAGPLHTLVFLGLDYCRAARFGWSPSATARMGLYDLRMPGNLHWEVPVVGSITRQVATQTLPSHWPLQATPLYSDAIPVRSQPTRCVAAPGHFPAGAMYRLDCPHYAVHCLVPCIPSYVMWALRVGNVVWGACTEAVTWDEVMDIAGFDTWGLPGTLIHGIDEVWVWPGDVSSLAGRCGHVFHDGSDPYLCGTEPAAGHPSAGAAPTAARAGAVNKGLNSRGGLWAFLVVLGACRHGWLPTWIVGALLFVSFPLGQAVREVPALYEVGYDSTLPCAVAWCHELACQNTHFCTTEGRLMRYFAQHAPYSQVRVALWLPLNGPVYFDVCRDATPQHFGAHLRAAGHDPRTNVLHVAFDTASTVVELLSVPGDDTLWWIVRDAVSRELLRPVAPWYGEGGRVIATLNSHGQAAGLTYSQEAAELHRIPQGARGIISSPRHFRLSSATLRGMAWF